VATLTRQAPAPAEATRVPAARAAGWVALGLGAAGVGYRVAVLAAGVPPTNSDEATMGLAALHLAQGRELPIYFYGQHYMGTIEAYLAAPLLAVAGPGLWALRVPNLLLYAGFLAAMWFLGRRLFGPWLATLTVGLLALGADRILKNQLISGGGYPEINPAAAALVLLSVTLRTSRLGYVAFGLLTGLMLWDDWLVLPYVVAAAAVLLHRGVPRRAWVALAGGLVAGAAPLLIHDLTSPWRRGALVTFLGLNGGGPNASWAQRLHGGFLVGLPMGTGMCPPGRCAAWQMTWAVVWLALLVAAGVLAWRDRTERVRRAARLALVLAAAASLLLYVRSNAAGNTPVESARYLHCLLISTPVVLWPLWSLATRSAGPMVARAAGVLGIAAIVATAAVATGALVRESSTIAAADDRQPALLAALRGAGVTRLYSDYWTCDYLAFAAAERVQCAVIDADLSPGFDRYLPYRASVAAAPRQTFALPIGSPESAAVRAALTASGVPFTQVAVAGYDIYRPASRVDLPRS
jgi:hypothetical protein